ncbi:MAG: YkgJ family cysteine cluster protein [Crenarchaeota archaeon]|nr:YkgJ family cysteine cluster protein [Thermoproteota archaeon]
MYRGYIAPKIYFKCTLCGECCKRYWIPITHVDLLRIYKKLNIDPLSFITFFRKDLTTGWDYPEILLEDGEYYMILSKRPDGSCIFNRYVGDRLICKIHEIKPLVCRFYPFIYWIDDDIVKFEVLDKAVGFCPGLGQGPPHDFEVEYRAVIEIRKAKEEYRRLVERWNKLVERGVVDPSPERFIRFLLNACLDEV